jgi:hypothetical protein
LLTEDSDAPIIMAGVTIFALLSWWFTPEDAWLSKKHISHFLLPDTTEGEEITGISNDVAREQK